MAVQVKGKLRATFQVPRGTGREQLLDMVYADERLAVQTRVVGVLTVDGTPVAFPADAADAALASGDRVELAGVELRSSGDGLTAFDAATGEPRAAHEAFWFAWSQFHPDTALWTP